MELSDIQGILVRGHGDLKAAAFLMLHFEDVKSVCSWLGSLAITPADEKPPELRQQIAFTYPGLARLGITEDLCPGFRPEFIQGMNTEYKGRVLGDLDESSADRWAWGGTANPEVHAAWMVYARDVDSLEAAIAQHESQALGNGLRTLVRLDSELNPASREHFGFRDGISQPLIEGLKRKGSEANTLPAGEFVLGYRNAYDEFPDSPSLPKAQDPEGLLAEGEKEGKDLGKNGSYMVFRQLRQEVAGFWSFIDEAIRKEQEEAGVEARIELASKMVGRWPGGAPLALSPEIDASELAEENDFLFHQEDAQGYRCPIGAHIRRANPRDALSQSSPETALKISNRHRILRRGRNFGPPLAATFKPEDLLKAAEDGVPRGLHFICFNTNINRQFEFIQHSWSNNTKFEGLYNDPDPILGIKDSRDKSAFHDFTIQACPVRRKIRGLSRFVHVMGGAYFFMPGLRAIKYLSRLHTLPS